MGLRSAKVAATTPCCRPAPRLSSTNSAATANSNATIGSGPAACQKRSKRRSATGHLLVRQRKALAGGVGFREFEPSSYDFFGLAQLVEHERQLQGGAQARG